MRSKSNIRFKRNVREEIKEAYLACERNKPSLEDPSSQNVDSRIA
jgi:hypothetical protein